MAYTSPEVKNRYNAKAYDRVGLMLPKGEKEKYKEIADSLGLSLNKFIQEAMAEKAAKIKKS